MRLYTNSCNRKTAKLAKNPSPSKGPESPKKLTKAKRQTTCEWAKCSTESTTGLSQAKPGTTTSTQMDSLALIKHQVRRPAISSEVQLKRIFLWQNGKYDLV